jgi:hypothetical protein
MNKTFRFLITLMLITLMTACGGGGGSGPVLFGSIAIDKTRTLETGIAAGYQTQSEADLMAKQNCGFPTCVVVKQFTGPGQCAVTAWSVGGIVSYGLGNTKSDAEVSALRNCADAGGRYCELAKYVCM